MFEVLGETGKLFCFHIKLLQNIGQVIGSNKKREIMKIVAIIGASDKPERYSNMAMHVLQDHGYDVVLVNPFKSQIEGQKCFKSVDEYDG